MSGCSAEDVNTTTGMARVRSSSLRRRSTSRPSTLGRFRSSRITLGATPISRSVLGPAPKKKSIASAPSRQTKSWLARWRDVSARRVSSTSAGLSSTKRISTSWVGSMGENLRWRGRSAAVEGLPYLAGQRSRGERLLEKGDPGVEDAVVHDGLIGVAGSVEHLQAGAHGFEAGGELPAADPRQHDVGDEEVNRPGVVGRDLQRLRPAGRRQHGVAVGGEHLAREDADGLVVLD